MIRTIGRVLIQVAWADTDGCWWHDDKHGTRDFYWLHFGPMEKDGLRAFRFCLGPLAMCVMDVNQERRA